jgi:hypothetical protein
VSADDVPPELRDLYRYTRRRKAVEVHRGAEAMPVIVDLERNGARVVRLEAPSPEDALEVMGRGPMALDADALAVGFDAWRSRSPTNPVKGRRWDFGDMDEIAALDAGLERGLLAEGLHINRITRAERRWTGVLVDYVHDRAQGRLTWAGVEVVEYRDNRDEGPVGRFARVALEAFDRQPFAELVTAQAEAEGAPAGFVDAMFGEHRRRVDVTAVRLLAQYARVIEGPDGPGLGE